MSMNEMENKIRELRQLQALIDEATNSSFVMLSPNRDLIEFRYNRP